MTAHNASIHEFMKSIKIRIDINNAKVVLQNTGKMNELLNGLLTIKETKKNDKKKIQKNGIDWDKKGTKKNEMHFEQQ